MATVAATTSVSTAASATQAASGGGLSFRQFLSDINPLQYIPVVGAVYRAVSGDEGNSTLRFVASLGTSFALGGPLGVGITVAEKITGIDPERIARSMLGRWLHPAQTAATTAAAAGTTAAGTAATGTTKPDNAASPTDAGDPASRPWSAAELSAYAASTGAIGDGTAAGGPVTADMLNGMELKRVSALYA